MKLIISLSLLLSFGVFADDHDSQESEWNVAEYYVSVFKDGKDMDDMMKWAEKWSTTRNIWLQTCSKGSWALNPEQQIKNGFGVGTGGVALGLVGLF